MKEKIKSITHSKKRCFYIGVMLFAILNLLYIVPYISPFQFSDGIPMLNRVYSFANGEMGLTKYLFTKHGNSIHPLVYITALFDCLLFDNSAILLRTFVCVGMFGTTVIFTKVIYDDNKSLIFNLLASFLTTIIVMGGYNFELYLPFQMVLTFSRFLFLGALIWLSSILAKDQYNKREYYSCLAICTIFSCLHGMGMMFALSVFYLHIITRQKVWKKLLSLLPLLTYTLLQLGFNGDYGEVSGHGDWLFGNIKVFLGCVCAFYGGLLYQLFNIPRRLSLVIGFMLVLLVVLILLYYFIIGILRPSEQKKVKILDSIFFLNRTDDLFFLGLLGISLLANLGAAAFTCARLDIYSIRDPLQLNLSTGRYLCFGIVPYIVFFSKFIHINFSKRAWRYTAQLFTAVLLVACFMCNYYKSQKNTIYNNKLLDKEAVACLSKFPLNSKEQTLSYGSFSEDWYYSERIQALYRNLKQEGSYIWKNKPEIGSGINREKMNLIAPIAINYLNCSIEDYVEVTLICADKPTTRYSPLVSENGEIVGFVYIDSRPGFSFDRDEANLYFENHYILKGFMYREYVQDAKIAVLDDERVPLDSKGVTTYTSVVETRAFDLTNEDGWKHGVYEAGKCILFEDNEVNNQIIESKYIGNSKGQIVDIISIDKEGGYIRVFLDPSTNISNIFESPEIIFFYM